MRQYRRPLLPPVTPPIPHGLQRGGVFEHADSPQTFKDVAWQTIPTNSPLAYEVPQNVLRTPIPAVPTTEVRPITGFGQTRINADVQPIPIRMGHPAMTAHGATEGGIFGPGSVYAYPVSADVPQVRTLSYRRGSVGRSPDGIGRVRSRVRALRGLGCGCGGMGGCGSCG